ncbi:hypothetical protein BJ138DRAFT_1013933 [Hygrophoropsis aurantiaca]|uniref:Uncharacterized protein n=1 Tax=Hygrophoropsis aurantiaca TaxID=72124 RepID=A0ACB8A390_9AGAM|nr:hypothetical protein BJ138DRAFT_1013933 [Hygrophoropsis aurantiaca]
MRALLEKVRAEHPDTLDEPRIKGKGKGKETLFRYAGEIIVGEGEIIIGDPRRASGTIKRKPPRDAFYEVKYEYDDNSTGPPPPTAVLITNLSPLTPNQQLRRHFGTFGNIISFEPQIDMETGGALGIVLIKYHSNEEAKRCVERAHGKKLGAGIGPADGGEELKVVFDGEGLKLKAVLKELADRKKREREERRRKEKAAMAPTPAATPKPIPTPLAQTLRPSHQLPPRPAHIPLMNDRSEKSPSDRHPLPSRVKRPPPVSERARAPTNHRFSVFNDLSQHTTPSSSSTPVHSRGRPSHLSHEYGPSPSSHSRSPSPIARRPGHPSGRQQQQKQSASTAVVEALARNGFEHVRVDFSGGTPESVREEDVRYFFRDFKIDMVLRDHGAWYVAFQTSDSARRAGMVLNSGARTLAHHSVTVTVCPPRLQVAVAPTDKTSWTEEEVVNQAEESIVRELKVLLEKDITERVIAVDIRKLVSDEKAKITEMKVKAGVEVVEQKPAEKEKRSLKGLSFRKPNKREREVSTKVVEEDEHVEQEEEEELPPPVEPPKKKRKKDPVTKTRKIVDEDLESEDDDTLVTEVAPEVRKRSVSEDHDEDEKPSKKKLKSDVIIEDERGKRISTKQKSKKAAKSAVHEIALPDMDFDIPETAQILVKSESPPSRSASPVQVSVAPPDDIFQDDEDVYFAKLAFLQADVPPRIPSPVPDSLPAFRKHITGSARTEGYYKISHAEKSAYVAQYALRSTTVESSAPTEPPPPQHVTSSRSNRANARRRAQGLEEINQVQRAVALSKGETAAAELSIKFNQLQTRKKHLRFARSPIHDWGLYAMERIARGEMVIEYVGEIIRAQVADKREKAYERQGIGSSYLFRIDEDLVVDATKKGNLGRLINHSCDPNCTAKIITINGEKKIVIYAKIDIELGDEITYGKFSLRYHPVHFFISPVILDYHFPIEQDKIPCLCGSAKCRGYLN